MSYLYLFYFTRKMYLYFSIGNGQPREPALCQLYRYTFVPYSIETRRHASCCCPKRSADLQMAASDRPTRHIARSRLRQRDLKWPTGSWSIGSQEGSREWTSPDKRPICGESCTRSDNAASVVQLRRQIQCPSKNYPLPSKVFWQYFPNDWDF